jgi:transcriptional regulator with XRE-family HTH domain
LLLSSLEASASSDMPFFDRHSERVMPDCSAFLNPKSSGEVQVIRNARYRCVSYNLIVLDWYLKEWLAATTTSQAELVRRTDYPKAKVSDLVTGKQRYNRDILNDIAAALNIHPFELLLHPSDAMAQRRIRKLAEQMVHIPQSGTVGDPDEEMIDTRKTG